MSVGGADLHQVFAPGRVNLIGDHTDYTGGLVFPIAIDRGIRITVKARHLKLRPSAKRQSIEQLGCHAGSWTN